MIRIFGVLAVALAVAACSQSESSEPTSIGDGIAMGLWFLAIAVFMVGWWASDAAEDFVRAYRAAHELDKNDDEDEEDEEEPA
jgi:TRAP-type C4-dicarboxylate transport system permease small subunit